MPDKKKGLPIINSMAKNIQGLIDNLYQTTNYAPISNKKMLDNLRKDIDVSISDLIDKNYSNNGVNMSKLYSRVNLMDTQSDKKAIENIENMFNDREAMDNILSTYMDNKYIRDLDLEIDTICKYMPKLEEALEVKKEGVLSADDFTKEFISIKNISSSSIDSSSFYANIDEIKRTYNIMSIIEEAYYNTSKYGEQFLYVVPYSKALTVLLNNKDKNNKINISNSINESVSKYVNDMYDDIPRSDMNNEIMLEYDDLMNYKVDLVLDTSESIQSILNEAKHTTHSEHFKDGPLINSSKLKFTGNDETTDGLITQTKKSSNVKTTGCLIRKLRRENVIPLYIDDICLGYYYIETDDSNSFEYIESLHDPIAGLKKSNYSLKVDSLKRDTLLKRISSKISSEIDAKFINANQDIQKEIYMILKHNDMWSNNAPKLTVTFIPPEDMIHMYFKKDPKTNRGISDLDKSLLPAKLYSCLYITNTVGILTRSQDKRAYFVKQHIDTNISGVLLNTINQIKKSNFGMREINNMNNILNITGRYNDYIIPVSQNNEKPIEFEIIQGQDINTKSDLMEMLESMAINSTGIPLEFLDSRRSVEFSRQLTLSNGKMARHVLKRQSLFQVFISNLITKIYNYHYDENYILEATLPPPSHLTINNTLDMMRNSRDLTESIIELQVHDKDRDKAWVPALRKKLMKYYMGSYVNWKVIEDLEKESKIECAIIDEEE